MTSEGNLGHMLELLGLQAFGNQCKIKESSSTVQARHTPYAYDEQSCGSTAQRDFLSASSLSSLRQATK